ncbi:MAG: hypothetical protein IJK60_05650 [Clostridia bacterium]|nr:hypothetical protein [Clostridia bacterium]
MQAFETKLKYEVLKTYLAVVKFNMSKFSIIGADENLRWVMSETTKQHIETELEKIVNVKNFKVTKPRLMDVKILIDDELPLGEIKLFVDGGVF